MSIWPFRRKSKRKNGGGNLGAKRATTDPITNMQRSASHRSIGSQRRMTGSQTELSGGLARKRTGRLKNRQQSDTGNKLVRDPERRAYSFSPGRKESLAIPKDIHRQYPVPPIPADAANMPGKTGTINPRTGARIYPTTTNDSIDRAPTLHKRSAVDLNHRKSSKKRKEDSERLSELKAMTKSMPPPSSRSSTTPDPFRTDTVKSRGIKRIFTNHASNMSLPHVGESMHSSNSSDAEQHTSYILKGIDLFSPRPTIRYAEPARQKHKSTSNIEKAPIINSKADEFDREKSRKRIEELADELDAHDLHELMDRDRRRRERKKQHDMEKMERRLARRKAKQEAAEKEAEANGEEPAHNRESGVLGHHYNGVGIAISGDKENRPPLIPRKSSRRNSRRSSVASSRYSRELTEKLQELQDDQRGTASAGQSPTDDFMRSASLPGTEPTSPYDEREEAVIQTAQIARLSRANMSPPASPRHFHDHQREQSNVSQMKDLPPAPILSDPAPLLTPPLPFPKKDNTPPNEDQKAEIAYRRSSETGSSYQNSSWKSWFKRTSKDRRSSTQSSFSNTTRESIIASQASQAQSQRDTQAPPPVAYATPVRQNSAIPKRTMSRFREDLPELPMSPPASRVQSPEAMPIPGARHFDPHRAHVGRELSDSPSGLRRYDSPNSFNRPTEAGSLLRYETPTTDRDAPSPEPVKIMSQSLASIDSEGSWLSGRPRADSKRSSAQRSSARSSRQQGDYNQNLSRHSHSSLQARRYKELSDHLDDGGAENIAEDEYYSRLTPDMYSRSHARDASRISGNPMPSSDEEDNGEKMRTPISAGTANREGNWGDVSRKPTIIRHNPQRTQSAQGILNNVEDPSDDEFDNRSVEYGLAEKWRNQGPDFRPRTPESPNKEQDYSEFEASPSGDKLERATSIDFKKNHIRHISAGSARLLDLGPRISQDGKRKSVGF